MHIAPVIAAALTLLMAGPITLAQSTNCLPKPKLLVAWQGTNVLRLQLAGEPAMNYAIQRSANFAQWAPIATNRSDSGVISLFQTNAAGVPEQFFRALSVDSADGLGANFIFNGESFAGWEGNTAQTFRVTNCAIVGGSLIQSSPENRFLCSVRRYTNFVLRLEFKLLGTNGFINSGIQFRSERVPGSEEVSGYQADIGAGYWGSLYDESRRGIVLASANQAAVAAVLKTNDWNQYIIRAEGARIRFWINGYQTIDYTEAAPNIPRYGIIGLQVHAGGLSEASFRKITLELLP